jgi:hypothetical protein
MIVARLSVETGPDGHRYLAGVTTSSWPLAVGTPVVVRKESDGSYTILELAPRSQNGLSFFMEADE